MFAQPEGLGYKNSKCYDNMKSLTELAQEKGVPVTQIATEKVEIITDFLKCKSKISTLWHWSYSLASTLLRYSPLDSPRNRLCYGSGSTIPSRNQTGDENALLRLVETVKLVSTETEFSDWAKRLHLCFDMSVTQEMCLYQK